MASYLTALAFRVYFDLGEKKLVMDPFLTGVATLFLFGEVAVVGAALLLEDNCVLDGEEGPILAKFAVVCEGAAFFLGLSAVVVVVLLDLSLLAKKDFTVFGGGSGLIDSGLR